MNNSAWKTMKLGELFDITSSKRVFKSEWKKQGVPFYRAREIVKLAKQGYVDNELYISDEMYSSYSQKYGVPKEGDIMVTGVGTLGICYVVKKDDKFYFKDGNIIWLKKKSEVSSKFIEYAFKTDSLRKQISSGSGATVGTYTIIKAKNTSLSIPSLFEQERIVKILDETFENIEKVKESTQKNLLSSRQLFDSYLNQAFSVNESGWIKTTLGSVLQKTETINPLKTPNKEFIYIDVSSVNKENLSIENLSTLIGKNAPSRARKVVKTNDVIFATVRPTLRRIAIVPDKLNNQVCSTGYFVLRTNEKLINRLVYYFLQTEVFMKNMESLQRGASYPAVTDRDVKSQIISFPTDISKQEALINQFDSLYTESKKLESVYQKKLVNLEKLKKSILTQAFSGNL